MTGYKILVVDDEQDVLTFLEYNLKKEGYFVYLASSGQQAIDLASEVLPQLILLDIMMPGIDGIETCEIIRANEKLANTIICFLSARSEDYTQIAAFEAGADGYLIKPVRPKLLVSYVKALLKRIEEPQKSTATSEEKVIHAGPLIIDRDRYLVLINDTEIVLPRKEFNLLCLLASKPQKVFTRTDIYDYLWGQDVQTSDRTIDVYIRKLREKFGDRLIKTIKGVGYKFDPNT
ncbi:MAG: response regulator transcription factor [Bacteroidales bacterium]|nr:response regulator transcription factor [Bacteroidales bacterium]